MRQLLQDLAKGRTDIVEMPDPTAKRGHLVIRTPRSLVSAGAERMLVEFSRAGWLDKARQQPDKVHEVLDKIKTDELMATVEAVRMGRLETEAVADDKASITIGFENGTFRTIHYLANGHKSLPKEPIEVFNGGRILQLDNFRILRTFGWSGVRNRRAWRQDKGQVTCTAAFVDAVSGGGPSPIPADELFEVAQATLDAAGQIGSQ